MKTRLNSLLTSLTLAVCLPFTSGCATSNLQHAKNQNSQRIRVEFQGYVIPKQVVDIDTYIPKGERTNLVNCAVIDCNGDRIPDLREIYIETKGDYSERK